MRDHYRPVGDLGHSALLISLLLVGIFSLSPYAAHAVDRDVVLNFLPPAGPVTGYRFYLLDESTQVEDVQDPGFIPPDSDGIARVVIPLEASTSHEASMTAYNANGESARSNSIQIAAVACDPALCDDDNPCTVDTCESGGCFNDDLPDGTTCDDTFVDTLDDMCTLGTCQGTELRCGSDAECDDGDACNGTETCDGGTVCLAGAALTCGVATPCAVPSCDPDLGCMTNFVLDGTACDDGEVATIGDACFSGICQGGQANIVVDDMGSMNLSEGFHTITVTGAGFVGKTRIRFVNGEGRKPRVKKVRVLDEGTLEVDVKVRRPRLDRPAPWDMKVKVRRVGEIVVPDAVVVMP